MFALSNARDYSFLKVPYLEREEEITDQSNFVNNVTQFYFRFPRSIEKNGRETGKNSRKPRKLSKVETRNLTETLSRTLLPGPNITL